MNINHKLTCGDLMSDNKSFFNDGSSSAQFSEEWELIGSPSVYRIDIILHHIYYILICCSIYYIIYYSLYCIIY